MSLIGKNPFQPGSSDVDWCEPNYVLTSHIAEFWNTVSNIFFFLVPPFMIRLFFSYTKRAGRKIQVLWIFLVVIGIGSVYFHATLSLVGQLLDEISIIWVLIAGYAIFLPAAFFPASMKIQRKRFVYVCAAVGMVITVLSFIYPYANAFILMILGVPAIAFVVMQTNRSNDSRIKELGLHCLYTWIIAVTIWICDRALCSFWLSISFPYLHALWHVLIFFSSNEAIIICSYLLIKQQHPHASLTIHSWPNANWGAFSLPYLKFEDDDHNDYSLV